jgi:hypothetical protein
VIRRVAAKNPDDIMPPPDQHKPVNEKQIDLLRQWIAEGAPDTEHWVFVPPSKKDRSMCTTCTRRRFTCRDLTTRA